jgi:hypothetical protein
MQPQPVPASASSRWQGPDGYRTGVALWAFWAVIGAGLTLWVFRAWEQPVPAFNPNDGPLPADANLDFWLGGWLMAVPLVVLTATAAAVGLQYVWTLPSPSRIRAAWIAAVTAAVLTDVAFIGTFAAHGALFGMAPGQVNWGLSVFAALFAAVGIAMAAILTAARARLRVGAAGGLRG